MGHALLRRFCALAFAAATATGAATARAESGDAAVAERLFLDGRAMMSNGRYAEACPMLAESQRIDPGVGTLLALGECYEKQGKTASAWATYREAEPMARRLGQKERAAHFAARAEALSATLSYLTLRIALPPRGLTVTFDETPLAQAAWSTSIPVDPGKHVIAAAAPGRSSWTTTLEVKPADRVAVDVPELDAAATPPEGPRGPENQGSTQRTLGWAGVVVGGVALGAGIAFGLIAKSKSDEANADHCSSEYCDPRGITLTRDAKSAALVSTVLFFAGGAVLATGIVLVVTTPSGQRIALAPNGTGAAIAATW